MPVASASCPFVDRSQVLENLDFLRPPAPPWLQGGRSSSLWAFSLAPAVQAHILTYIRARPRPAERLACLSLVLHTLTTPPFSPAQPAPLLRHPTSDA